MSSKRKVARECIGCDAEQPPVYGIPDPCLGYLPGVRNACCGHGTVARCYVQYEDGTTVRGDEARDAQIALGGNPAELSRPRSDTRTWRKKGD